MNKAVIPCLIFLLLTAAACYKKAPQQDSSAPALTVVPVPHPLSIEALRNRKWEPGAITVEREVARKDTYTSYIVSYRSDGNTIYALLNLPHLKDQQEKLPTVIVNHGYIAPDEYSTVNSYRNISSYYASRGFLVIKPDYRGHDKSGGAFTIAALRTIYYAIDVLNLIASLPGYPHADTNLLFMYGHSMGGEVTLRVLEATDAVRAATLWAPVSAPFPESTYYFRRRGNPDFAAHEKSALDAVVKQTEYAAMSPLYFTQYIKIPLLLHHGTEDESVPYEWSATLAEEFRKTGVHFTFYAYEKENHNLSRRSYLAVAGRDVELFRSLMQ